MLKILWLCFFLWTQCSFCFLCFTIIVANIVVDVTVIIIVKNG